MDGTLDPGVNLTGDYGPSVNIASFEYLVFGGRDLGGLGSFTPCLLNDVRVYRIALSQAEVLALLPASRGAEAGQPERRGQRSAHRLARRELRLPAPDIGEPDRRLERRGIDCGSGRE